MGFSKWLHFEPNNIYPFQFALYTITGFWKIESKSKWKQFLYKLYHMVNEISYSIITLAVIIDAYYVRKDVVKLSFNLCTSIALAGSIAKIWVLNFKKKEAERIRIMLDNHLNLPNIGNSKSDKEIFEKNSRGIATATISFLIIAELLVFFWSAFPLLDKPEQRRIPFPVPPYPIFKKSPVYELMYAYQVIALLIISLKIVAYDTMFWGFLSRVGAHFEILAKNFEKMNDLYPKVDYERMVENYLKGMRGKREMGNYCLTVDNEMELGDINDNEEEWRSVETVKIIKKNIVHHKAILRILQDINNVYQAPVLFQISCCAGILGTAAYGMIVKSSDVDSEFIQRILYVFGTMYDSFFYCYYGTQIVDRSNLVKSTLYDCPWYEMEKSPKKLIIFIINYLQKPAKVWAFKMFSVTLRTYLQLLKVSYDTIAVLNQTSGTSRNSNQAVK